jgi:primosomal protein N'
VFAAVYPLIRTRAFTEPFDYAVPEEARRRIRAGALVVIPLGSQQVFGLVVELRERSTHAGRVVPLLEVVDLPEVPSEHMELAGRLAAYYITAAPVALALVAPPTSALRVEKRLELTEGGRAALKVGEAGLAAWAPAGVDGEQAGGADEQDGGAGEQAGVAGEQAGLGAVGGAEFVQDAGDVALDGGLGQVQAGADGGVGQPLAQAGQDLGLAGGEAG